LSGDASDERVISPPVYSTAFLITCAAAVVRQRMMTLFLPITCWR